MSLLEYDGIRQYGAGWQYGQMAEPYYEVNPVRVFQAPAARNRILTVPGNRNQAPRSLIKYGPGRRYGDGAQWGQPTYDYYESLSEYRTYKVPKES